MSKKAKARISWKMSIPLKMASFASGTVSAMTNNDTFKNPDVALDDVTKGAKRVVDAYGRRKNGPVAKDELKNGCIDLDEKLHVQALYVSKIADGDETIIHSAGFESTKDAVLAKIAKPTNTTAPKAVGTPAGGMKVTVDAVAGAKLYCFILVVDAVFNVTVLNGQLQIPLGTQAFIINSTKHIANFVGLPTLKNVQIAVVAMNSNGASDISPIATASTIA